MARKPAPKLDEKALTKGELRKLNALRKSVGEDIGEKAFVEWLRKKPVAVAEPEDGSKDAFVHISAVERAGIMSLNEGQKVEYDLQPGRDGKSSAENLKLVD